MVFNLHFFIKNLFHIFNYSKKKLILKIIKQKNGNRKSSSSHTTNQEEGTRTVNPNNQRCGSGKPPNFPTLSLSRNLFPGKKMATKVPIGAGLSLASPPCASNVRSLVLKSAFFGHGGTALSDSLSGCCSNFVSSV